MGHFGLMLPRQLARPVLLAAACYFLGCSSGPSKQTSNGLIKGTGTGTSVPSDQGQVTVDASTGQGGNGVNGDAGSSPSQQPAVVPPSQRPVVAVDAGGDGADAANPPDATPRNECDTDGGCVFQCTNQSAICAVISGDVPCELNGFVGASAEVDCGQQTLIGTACCGGCGCVPVEVFFDGTNCWQGAPACTLPELTDGFFDPHAPGAADAGWISAANNGVQGQFYLGTTGP